MLRTVIAALVLVPSLAFAAATKVSVDKNASSLKWKGTKVFSSDAHVGTVNISGGNLMVDGDKLTGGEIVIDMTTIKNTDVTDAGMNGKLVGHLNSPDFFDTANNKEAKFVIKKSTVGAGGEMTIDGDLTIRGKTNPQTIKAKVTKEGKNWVATGKTEIDRTQYGVKHNSQSAFPNLVKTGKDKVINDKIELDFTIKTM